MIEEILREIDYKNIIIDKIDLERRFNRKTIYKNEDLEKSEIKVKMILAYKNLVLIIENINLKEKIKEGNEISLSTIGLFKNKAIGVNLSMLKVVKVKDNEILAFTNLEDDLSAIYWIEN